MSVERRRNVLLLLPRFQREAQEQRNKEADPFTRLRCAPTLVTKVKERATRFSLSHFLFRRHNSVPVKIFSEVCSKNVAPLRPPLLRRKNSKNKTNKYVSLCVSADSLICPLRLQLEKAKLVVPTISTVSETSLSTATTTSERGSFTSFSEQHDEMFTSHDFELDLVI